MLSNDNQVILEIDNQVATIQLNRNQACNAFNLEMIQQITDYLNKLKDDPVVRIVVIRASGKHFSAGADLHWMRESINKTVEDNYHEAMILSDMYQALYNLPKLCICLVHGSAFGGALGLIACCDVAIASDDAKFCISEVKLGIAPAIISPYIINKIGYSITKYYALTAKVFDAKDALTHNLVHITCSEKDLDTNLNHLIQDSLKNLAPQALAITKNLINQSHYQQITGDLLDNNAKLIANLRCSIEGQRGLTAFLEKIPPSW